MTPDPFTDGGHGPRTTAAIREWTGAWPTAQEPTAAPTRCGHRSRIGTHCHRPAGHTGPHIAGFTDEENR